MNLSSSQIGRNPIEQLSEEFVERLRAGEQPSLSEFIARRPDLEDDIRTLFPTLVLMEQVGSGHGSQKADAPVTRDGSVPEQIGDYRILREVRRGGMGVVYESRAGVARSACSTEGASLCRLDGPQPSEAVSA